MHRKLSARFFIISLTLISLLALAGLSGLYFYLNQASVKPTPAILNGPVTAPHQDITLSLSGPDDNSLVFDPNLLVGGTTLPEATIIINWNDNNKVVRAGNDGTFSATLKLDAGVNNLKVAAFDSSGNSKEEDRLIFYSTEKLQ